MRIWMILWSLLWSCTLPLIVFYLWWRGQKDPKYFIKLAERFGMYQKPLSNTIWIHAVSLGELRSAVPLIQTFLSNGEKVVTTHFTPAGRNEAEKVFAVEIAQGQIQVVWVPFELAFVYRSFFNAFQPKFGLVMEAEIWPRMVFAARAAKKPLFMCNAQYSNDAFMRDNSGLRIRQKIMREFSGAMVKSNLKADRFKSIGVRNIVVTGELRFDQPVLIAQIEAGLAARQWIGAVDRRVITIASAIEHEDEVYIKAIQALNEHHTEQDLKPPLFVYVPRRPERFETVTATLIDAQLDVLTRTNLWTDLDQTRWKDAPDCPNIIVGDSLGEMNFYLSMCDDVIIGGGFNPKGAHNISEALVLGKPVLTGPHVKTIEYPFAEAQNAGVASSVQDAAALAKALIRNQHPSASDIQSFIEEHSNATSRTLATIPQLLKAARF